MKAFRIIHTIKGSGSVVGFSKMVSFAHSFENFLSLIRAKQIPITVPALDLMLACRDVLKEWVQGLRYDEKFELDTTKIVAILDEATREYKVTTISAKPTPAFGLFEEEEGVSIQGSDLVPEDEKDRHGL